MTKTVYFDTNVFHHIHTGKGGATEADRLALRSAIRSEKISIVLSIWNIEEVIAALESSYDNAIAELRLMKELTNWRRMGLVKLPEQLLSNDIHCYAQNKALLKPFLPLNSQIQSWLRSWTNFSQKDINQLQPVLEETRQQKESFVFDMMQASSLYEKRPQEQNFADYFETEASYFAERLAEHDGALNECQERGIDGLLRIRSVHLAVGAHLSLVYSYTVEGRTSKGGDSRDMKHAVSASAAEIFVTHDEKLAKVLTRIPIEDFQVMNLHGLLKEIC